MKNPFFIFILKKNILMVLLLLGSFIMNAQVGIGTNDPHISSMLDVQSNTLGVLIPRMSTLQRENIVNPANALLVYDLGEHHFFYYDSIPPNSKWVKILTNLKKRENYVLVKSETDLPTAGLGGAIELNSGYLYEINGTINLSAPINLNNAYISGQDATKDKLVRASGTVFSGNSGGSIQNITITGGGTAFNITGGTSLTVQNTIIDNMGSVGTISGLGLYFGNVIQYINNDNGITYNNIANLLLNNQGWFGNNTGTYEKFTGSFGVIEKVSGFSTTNGGAVAMDFSANPIVGNGVLQSVAFSGTTSPSQYVKGYTTGSYSGYNFTNSWTVECPGIPREGDREATGDINFPGTVTGADGYSTSFKNGAEKVWGVTTSNNLYRFTRNGDNRITYRGVKKRFFQVNASLSYQLSSTDTAVRLYLAKNGVEIPNSSVYVRNLNTSSISSASISTTVEMKKDEYIEIWAQRISGSGKMFTVSLNLSAR